MVLKNKGYNYRELITILGKIRYRRTLLAPVGEDSVKALAAIQKEKYVCPLDMAIGVNNLPFKITVRMMVAMAKEAIRSTSYERAAQVIQEHYGVKIGTANVRFVTDYVGSVVYEEDKARADAAKEAHADWIDKRKKHRRSDDILYLEMDGAMVNTRIQTEDSSWKECKIGMAFHSSDIRAYRTDSGEIRRQILKKRIVGYIGNYNTFKYHLLAIASDYNYQYCTKIVVISDGASWIKTIVDELFPDAVHILDLCHVKEHVGNFGKWLIKDDHEAHLWINRVCALIENSETDKVLEILKPYKDVKCPPNVLNLYTYIENHKTSLDYKSYKEANYFLGSGAIESANKYTMQNRMKLQGMRWNIEPAQRVLSLKARLESDHWYEVEPLLIRHINSLGGINPEQ